MLILSLIQEDIYPYVVYTELFTVSGINSIYSQLFGNTEEISIKDSKNRKLSGSLELPYILQGFLQHNFSGEYSRDWSAERSSKVTITIEDKVRSILSVFKDDESKKIDRWSDRGCLVAGHATVVNYEMFSSRITDFFRSYDAINYPDFESFLRDIRYDPGFPSMWSEFTEFVCNNDRFSFMGIYAVAALYPKTRPIKCIAVDLKYPVIIHFSKEKLLISNSENESISMLNKMPYLGILGILRKADTNLYTIKPLAMWQDLSFEEHSDYIKGASHFIKRKESTYRIN